MKNILILANTKKTCKPDRFRPRPYIGYTITEILLSENKAERKDPEKNPPKKPNKQKNNNNKQTITMTTGI